MWEFLLWTCLLGWAPLALALIELALERLRDALRATPTAKAADVGRDPSEYASGERYAGRDGSGSSRRGATVERRFTTADPRVTPRRTNPPWPF